MTGKMAQYFRCCCNLETNWGSLTSPFSHYFSCEITYPKLLLPLFRWFNNHKNLLLFFDQYNNNNSQCDIYSKH